MLLLLLGIQLQTAESLVIGEMVTNKIMIILNKIDLLLNMDKIEAIKKKIMKTINLTKFNEFKIVEASAKNGNIFIE